MEGGTNTDVFEALETRRKELLERFKKFGMDIDGSNKQVGANSRVKDVLGPDFASVNMSSVNNENKKKKNNSDSVVMSVINDKNALDKSLKKQEEDSHQNTVNKTPKISKREQTNNDNNNKNSTSKKLLKNQGTPNIQDGNTFDGEDENTQDQSVSPLTKSLLLTLTKNQKALKSYLYGSLVPTDIPTQAVQEAFVSLQQAVDDSAETFSRTATAIAKEWYEFSRENDMEMNKLKTDWEAQASGIRDKIQASKEASIEAQRQMDEQGSDGVTRVKLLKTKLETLIETKEELLDKIKTKTRRLENIDKTLFRNAQETQRSLMNEYARSLVSYRMDIEKLNESIATIRKDTESIQYRALQVIESANDNLIKQEDQLKSLVAERDKRLNLVKAAREEAKDLSNSIRVMSREKTKLIDDIEGKKQEIERTDRVLIMIQNGEILPTDVIPRRSTLSKHSTYMHNSSIASLVPRTTTTITTTSDLVSNSLGSSISIGLNDNETGENSMAKKYMEILGQSDFDSYSINSSLNKGSSSVNVSNRIDTKALGSPSKSSKILSNIDKACFDMNLNKRIDNIINLSNDTIVENSASEQNEHLMQKDYSSHLDQYIKDVSRLDMSSKLE